MFGLVVLKLSGGVVSILAITAALATAGVIYVLSFKDSGRPLPLDQPVIRPSGPQVAR